MRDWFKEIHWNDEGLVPVIVQESKSNRVLMHAWMNQAALIKTEKEGKAVFWSRSRQSLWVKGETSGHTQLIESISIDCDADTLLLKVRQQGGIACHTGRHSCFYRRLDKEDWRITEPVLKEPEDIYS